MIYIVLFYKIFIYNASNFTMPLEKRKSVKEKNLSDAVAFTKSVLIFLYLSSFLLDL